MISREHNPIAVLISKLQNSWNEQIFPNPEIQLVRWLVKNEETKLFEGLLQLESTENGRIPDLTVTLLTKFASIEEHGTALASDWIKMYKENMPDGHNWDPSEFVNRLKFEDGNQVLLDVLSSFQNTLPEKDRFVTLCLYPSAVSSYQDYSRWIEKIINLNRHKNIRFMVFDYQDKRLMDYIFSQLKGVSATLEVPLDLDGAKDKIASSGDPNSTQYKLKHCISEMAKAAAKKKKDLVHKWGERALEVGQKSGEKITFATAHIVYAANLFNLKEFKEIDKLLKNALTISKQGVAMGDKNCQPLVYQVYGFLGSSQQLQKNRAEALELYCKQAETALEYGLTEMSLNAYWMALTFTKNKQSKAYSDILIPAYKAGTSLNKENMVTSPMPFIAIEYYDYLKIKGDKKKCEDVDSFMQGMMGLDWKKVAEDRNKNMTLVTK